MIGKRVARTTGLLLILVVLGCSRANPPTAPPASSQTSTGTVTIEIRHGETTSTWTVDDVASGSTVESVMRSIQDVEVSIRGTGVTAFVDRIGDTSTGASEGWTYEVDGEFANEGIGTKTVDPPTTIRWTYGGYEAP